MLRLPHDPLEHLQRSPPNEGRLRVVTANWGDLGSDPRKVPCLITYLACAEPDVAQLQQASPRFAAAWLGGVQHRVCVGPLFPRGGGGLVTVVPARLLNRSQVCERAQHHSLCVRGEPARGAVLATVNMHLPPALPAARRRAVVNDATPSLRTATAHVQIVADDLNKAHGPRGGRWLSKALGPKSPLAGFRAPYRPGGPKNVVWQVGRPSERKLGWILAGPETLCVGAEKVLLPGLSTHRMVQSDLGFVGPSSRQWTPPAAAFVGPSSGRSSKRPRRRRPR